MPNATSSVKVKTISLPGLVVHAPAAVRNLLGLDHGGEVVVKVDGQSHGPFDVGRVPLSTLRLLRYVGQEDAIAFIPQSLNVADGTDAELVVHELESGDFPGDELESSDFPADESEDEVTEVESEVATANEDSDGGEEDGEDEDEPSSTPETKKEAVLAAATYLEEPFTLAQVVYTAAEYGFVMSTSYAAECLRNHINEGNIRLSVQREARGNVYLRVE